MKTRYILLLLVPSLAWAFGTVTIHYVVANPSSGNLTFHAYANGQEGNENSLDMVVAPQSTSSGNLTVAEDGSGWPIAHAYQVVSGVVPISDVQNADAPPDMMLSGSSSPEEYNYYFPDQESNEFSDTYRTIYVQGLDPLSVSWRQSPSGDDYQADTSAQGPLSQELFREGISKVVRAVTAAGASGGGGGGGGGGSTDNSEDLSGRALAADDAKPSAAVQSAAGSSASGNFTSTVTTAIGVDHLSGNLSMSGGNVTAAGTIWGVVLPGNGNVTTSLNPLDNTRIAEIFEWFKLVVTVLIFVAFEWFCWAEFQKGMFALGAAPQARGNTVAGTGGQVTGLAAAAVLAVLLTAVPATLVAIFTGAFSAIGYGGSPDLMPHSGDDLWEAAWYLLNAAIPTSTLLVVLAEAWVVRKAGTVLVTGSFIAIKFVVPVLILGLLVVPAHAAGFRAFIDNESSSPVVARLRGDTAVGGVKPLLLLLNAGANETTAHQPELEVQLPPDRILRYTLTTGAGTFQSTVSDPGEGSWVLSLHVYADADPVATWFPTYGRSDTVAFPDAVEYFWSGFGLVGLWEVFGLALRMLRMLRGNATGGDV